MKKILFLLALLITFTNVKAQSWRDISNAQSIQWLQAKEYLGLPFGSSLPVTSGSSRNDPAIFFKTTDGLLYTWNGTAWNPTSTSPVNIYNTDGSLKERTVTIQDDIDEHSYLLFQANDISANLYDMQVEIEKNGVNLQWVSGLTTKSSILRVGQYGIVMSTGNTTTTETFTLNLENTHGEIIDLSTDKFGLTYNADYSATFIDRSLVDKGYVDSKYSLLDLQAVTHNGYFTTNPIIVSGNILGVIDVGTFSNALLYTGADGGVLQLGNGVAGTGFITAKNITHTSELYLPNVDAKTLALSVNGNYADNDGNITISVGGTGWGVTGNSGLTGGINFIGTTDNVDVWFKRQGNFAGIIGSGNTTFGLNAGNSGKVLNIGMTAYGVNSLQTATGTSNVAFGSASGFSVTTGQRNSLFGGGTGGTLETGSFNTFLGYLADADDPARSNSIAIGYGATATADQQLVFSNNVNQMSLPGFTTGAGYVLTDVAGNGILTLHPVSGGTTPGIEDVLLQNQVFTGSRTMDVGGDSYTIASTAFTDGLFSIDGDGSFYIGDKVNNLSVNIYSTGSGGDLFIKASGGIYVTSPNIVLNGNVVATTNILGSFLTGTLSSDVNIVTGSNHFYRNGSEILTSPIADALYVPLTRTVNGQDLSSNITVTAAAGTLTGTTLNSSVVSSSLTSVGTITTGVWNGTTIAVTNGGTGITSFGTGIATWLETPSSSNFAATITNETGTGLVVFSTTPTFSTSIITPKIIGGTGTTQTLIFQNTSGNATTGADFIWNGGNNGATELMRLSAAGVLTMTNNGAINTGGNFTVNSVLATGILRAGAAQLIQWSGRSGMTSPSDGNIVFSNNAVSAGSTLSLGTSAAVASAMLDINSTTKGMLLPRMTTTQKNAISSPAEGLEVYDLTLHKKCVYTGSAWETVTSL